MINKVYFALSVCFFLLLTGCGQDQVGPIESIYASSEKKSFADTHASAHVMDATTASWCGGTENGGTGEKIVISFKKPVVISGFYIINGDVKNYGENNRVKILTGIHVVNGKEITQDLVLQDHAKIQYVKLKEKITGSKVTFVVKDIYRGTKGESVCITEIAFRKFSLKPVARKMNNVKINYKDFILTLSDGGKISGYGDMFSKDCRQKLFSTGSWGFLQDKQVYIHLDCVLFKKQGDCVDSCPDCPQRENKQYMFTFKTVAELMKHKIVEKK